MVASSRRCPNCNSSVVAGDIHCGVCGALLDRDPTEISTYSSLLIKPSSTSGPNSPLSPTPGGLLQRRTVIGGMAGLGGLFVGGVGGAVISGHQSSQESQTLTQELQASRQQVQKQNQQIQ